MAKDHDVGVLFVHGMGDQGRGDTVGQMGEAVAEWLRRETEGTPTEVTIRHASLKESHPELGDAAEIHITFDGAISPQDEVAGAHAKPVARWILAESWWGGSFRPASYLETALWAISVGPWLVASQLDAVLQRTRSNPVLRWILIPILGLSAGVVAALITPLALALLVVALLPIPGLRDLVLGVQRNLSGSYGDLSILVRSPVRFAGMWSTVLDDIQELSKHCKQVVVVAHSQGSAVSWMAIRRLSDRIIAWQNSDERSAKPADPVVTQTAAPPAQLPDDQPAADQPEPVAAFITFGQALRKLKLLYLVHTRATFAERFFYLASAIMSTAALAIAFVTVLNRLRSGGLAGDWRAELYVLLVVGLAIVAIAGILAFQCRRWVDETETELKREADRVHAAMPQLAWIDLWGSADPASNGPLFIERPKWVSTYKVRNYGSTILDHTTYWSNTTEFVTEVIERVQATSPTVVVAPRPADQKRTTVTTRHDRVQMLVITRIVYFASLAAVLLSIDATAIGRWALDMVGSVIGQPALGGPEALIGYGVVAGIGLAVWVALLALFNGIVAGDAADYFRTGAPHHLTVRWAAWWLVTAFIAIGTVWLLLDRGLMGLLVGWAVVAVGGIVLTTTALSRGGVTLAPPAVPTETAEPAADPG